MFGNFNVPNCDWVNGAPLPDSYYYNKIQGNSIDTATCFLGLDQRSNYIINIALLDAIFSNISELSASISSCPVATPDK
jgi:hypothetical protein